MLRPHTFSQLNLKSFVLVLWKKRFSSSTKEGIAGLLLKRKRAQILGYYIEFQSKTLPTARAYFPNLSNPWSYYAAMCPVKAIQNLAYKGWLQDRFLKTLGKGKSVNEYLQTLTGSKQPVPFYALRIGGRTWNISQGLDRQFVDYLGTWKSPEASARYYREQPAAVLRKLRRFYYRLPNPSLL